MTSHVRAVSTRSDSTRAGALAFLCLAIVALLAVCASPVLAAQTRPNTGISIGPDGAGGISNFSNLRSVAIDQASGDVYAYAAGSIYKFDAAGTPLTFPKTGTNAISEVGSTSGGAEYEIAIAPVGSPAGTAGDIYVANNGPNVSIYSPEGESLGSVSLAGETCGVATDAAGHVFSGTYSSRVTEFTPSANPFTAADKTGESTGVMSSLCNVAVGPSGIYGFQYSGGVRRISNLADSSAELIDPSAPTGAVDPVDGTFYADRRESVGQYDAAGNLEFVFANGISESFGVAVRHSTDRVYVANHGRIDVFGSAVVVPDVTTESATEVRGTAATLNGTVNPGGIAVSNCVFEYGRGGNFTSSVPCEQSVPTDENDHAVTAHLTGLDQNQFYSFRLAAANANGEGKGAGESFGTKKVVETGEATAITSTGATLNGTVFPGGEAVTACFFEYGPTGGSMSTAPCEQTVPTDEEEHTVSAAVTGLEFGARHYEFRLVVEQAGERAIGGRAFLTTPGPEILFARTASVGTSEASVEANVAPRGEELEFFVEYGTTASYGNTTPNFSIGGVEGSAVVAETLTGLSEGTTYHWRVVFVSPGGTVHGPDLAFLTRTPEPAPETGCSNQAFRTGAGASLPDCRAYEQVSPVEKNGTNIQHDINIIRASTDGNRFTFAANAGIPAAGGGSSPNFAAIRGEGEWTTWGLHPIVPAGGYHIFMGFDENVRAAASSGPGIFFGEITSGDFPEHELGNLEPNASLGDFANDPNKFNFESTRVMAPGAVAGTQNDYLWDHGVVTLVGRIPAGSASFCDDEGGPACVPAPAGSFIGAYNWQQGAATTANGGAGDGYYPVNTISDDGSKSVFTAGGSGQLYLRENGTSTTKVSASQRSNPDPHGTKPAAFLGATADDSKIFFASCEKLTDDSVATSTASASCIESSGGEALQGQDLYEFDTATGQLKDLTVEIHHGVNPLGAAVLGLVGTSADGSYVYFVANGAMTSDAEPGTCESGQNNSQCNLYLAHEGTITLIARLAASGSEGDHADWIGSRGFVSAPRWKTARVSANGTVVFSSVRSLTGYPNVNCTGGPGALRACAEIYRYAPGEAGPKCISCNPTGAAPTGDAEFELHGSAFSAGTQTAILSRNISTDGNQVFFNSPDRLLAADHNTVQDVYEWEASGSGSCKSAQVSGGCLYLISSGTSTSPSFFGDSSLSGKDVFFFTEDQLVPQDKDALVDAYDARVEGGLAEQNKAATAPPCSGEACKGPATVAPSESSPGSGTFAGPTNQQEVVKQQCKKGSKNCKKSKKKHKKHKKGRGHKSPGKSHGNRGGSK